MSIRTDLRRALASGAAVALVGGALTLTAGVGGAAAADDYAPVPAVLPTLAGITLEPTGRAELSAYPMWCWEESTMPEDAPERQKPAAQAGFTPRDGTSAGIPGSDASFTAWIADGDSIHYYGTSAACNRASGVHGDLDGAFDLAATASPPRMLEEFAVDPGDGATFFDGSWWRLHDVDNADGGIAPRFVFTGDKVLGPFRADALPIAVWYGNVPGLNTMITPNPGSRLSAADSANVAVAQPGLSVLREVCTYSGQADADARCDVDDDGAWGKDVTVPDGAAVYWRTTVLNTGNLPLSDIRVDADSYNPGLVFPDSLAVEASVSARGVTASLRDALDGVTSPVKANADFVDPTRLGAFATGQSIGERYRAAAEEAGHDRVLVATDEATARTLEVPAPVVPETVDPEPQPEPELPLTEQPEGEIPSAVLALTGGGLPVAGIVGATLAVGAGIVALLSRRRRHRDA